LRLPLDSAIAKSAREYETIVACAKADPQKQAALLELGIEVLCVNDGNGQVDLRRLCKLLGEKNIDSILLEGGGTMNDAMLRQELVQELQVFVAPKIFGGAGAKSPVEGIGVELPAQAAVLHMESVTSIGEDLLIVYRR
jgi:diaminohydroxyphosphoribosylaminopyrimidine deaminase/5-amino-6-(5-phosphoribosylamino)uracil reductase